MGMASHSKFFCLLSFNLLQENCPSILNGKLLLCLHHQWCFFLPLAIFFYFYQKHFQFNYKNVSKMYPQFKQVFLFISKVIKLNVVGLFKV